MDAHLDHSPAQSRVPTEILLKCFSLMQVKHSLDVLDAPWSLSHVCSRWRSIVFDAPELWARIVIPGAADRKEGTPGGEARRVKSEKNLLPLVLERSQPLSLTVICHDNRLPLFPLLVQQCRRWKEVDLLYNVDGIHSLLRETFKAQVARAPDSFQFPSLQVLALHILNEDARLGRAGYPDELSYALLRSTNLERLSFHGPSSFLPLESPFARNVHPTPSPWTHVTLIDLKVESTDLRSVAIAAPSLIDCRIEEVNAPRDTSRSFWNLNVEEPIITLSRLQSLALILDAPSRTGFHFEKIAFPNLRDLTFDFSEDARTPLTEDTFPSIFSAFISRSKCTITSLACTIGYQFLNVRILNELPFLRRLCVRSLTSISVTDVIQILGRGLGVDDDAGIPVCPELESMVLEAPSGADAIALRDFIRRRANEKHPVHLKHFKFIGRPEDLSGPEDVVEEILRCKVVVFEIGEKLG